MFLSLKAKLHHAVLCTVDTEDVNSYVASQCKYSSISKRSSFVFAPHDLTIMPPWENTFHGGLRCWNTKQCCKQRVNRIIVVL